MTPDLLRPDLRGRSAYGAPQLDVPVRLNTNENSHPVPPAVVGAITRAIAASASGLNRYPDRDFWALRQALARYLTRQTGVTLGEQQIWAANGSNEVLAQLVQAFGGAGRVALGFTPAYSMHPIIAGTMGMTWVDGQRGAPSGVFDLDADAVARQVEATQPHVVFLCSPNNPTGTALPRAVVRAALEVPGSRLVVVDEAYAEFARDPRSSVVDLLREHPTLVVTRTLSKAFALAGARLGYLAAAPELIEALLLVRLPYHLSDPTQVIARVALEHADDLLATVEQIKDQRDRIVAVLSSMGFDVVPSDANFVLFGGRQAIPDARATWAALVDVGVLVRDVGIEHYLRVTAGTEAETSAFLAAIAQLAPTRSTDE